MIKETEKKGLEYVYHQGELYCIILRDSYEGQGIEFFTPDSFSQQLGFLPHKKGNVIKPHKHKINKREILFTQEVLFMKKGKVKVNFYDPSALFVGSEIVGKGDVILLAGGGHGFEIMDEAIMIEIKQGPYVGEEDKMRFEGVEGRVDTGK